MTQVYNAPFSAAGTVKAIAVAPGKTPSAIMRQDYVVDPTLKIIKMWTADNTWVYAPASPFDIVTDANPPSDGSVLRIVNGAPGQGWSPGDYPIIQSFANFDTGTPDGVQNMIRLSDLPSTVSNAVGGIGSIIIPPAPTGVLQFVSQGDSITLGYGTSLGTHPWPVQAAIQISTNLGHQIREYTSAHGGRTLVNMQGDAPSDVDPKYNGTTCRTLTIFGGTNDLFFGATAAATIQNLVDYCTARKVVGWRIAVFTMLPRSDTGTPDTFPADRDTFNAFVRDASHLGVLWDAVVDAAALPQMGQTGDELDQTYYGDKVHPNNAGALILATLSAPIIQSLF